MRSGNRYRRAHGGNGPYSAELSALRSFTGTGSLLPATAASTPTITLGTSSATLSGEAVANNDSRIRYLGGHTIETVATSSPGDQARTAKNLSFSSSSRDGVACIVEFYTSCPQFEIHEYHQTRYMRLLVNNENAATWTLPNDGTSKYRLIDFTSIDSSPVPRRIRIESNNLSNFRGLKLGSTGELFPLPDTVTQKICWLGDSFIEGTGTGSPPDRHYALAAYASKLMGFKDYWLSGFGGTGYNVSFYPGFGSTRPSLADRIGWDGVGATVYVIGMGFNDLNADADLPAKVKTTLDTLRANNPRALVVVLGPWGNGSGGTAKSTVEASVKDACAGRPGVKFISIYDVSFTKSDASHPDLAGHAVLGAAIAARIRAWLGAPNA